MVEEIRTFILANPQLFPNKASAEIDPLLISKGHSKNAKSRRVTILWFNRGEDRPFLSTRFCLDPSYNRSLVKESDASSYFRKKLILCVPESLGIHAVCGTQVYFEKPVAGKSLSAELVDYVIEHSDLSSLESLPALVAHHFSLAATVIESLDLCAIKTSATNSSEEIAELLSDVSTYARGGIPIPATEISSLAERILRGVLKRKRLVHFDFVPGNIFSDGDSFTIIDWEHSRESCLLPVETMRFIAYYFGQLVELGVIPSADFFDCYFILQSNHWFAPIARSFLARTLGLEDGKWGEELLRSAFALHLLNEYRLQCETSDPKLAAAYLPAIARLADRTLLNDYLLERGMHSQGRSKEDTDEIESTQRNMTALSQDRDRWRTQYEKAAADFIALQGRFDSLVKSTSENSSALAADRDKWQSAYAKAESDFKELNARFEALGRSSSEHANALAADRDNWLTQYKVLEEDRDRWKTVSDSIQDQLKS